MIAWIGKQLGLSREEIDKLRLDSQFDMMLAAIDNKLRDALRSRYDAFRATYS
jgi:hypothetical protein